MTPPSTLRVAVIGAGPAGFFVVEHLLQKTELDISVDLYDALPTPYGLVRFGVAPDHEKIKNVTRSFDKAAARKGFRFYGNVEVGRAITLDDLRRHYHQVCFTTGAQTDRRMGIPGEDLKRSHAATEFVAWYNGHPAYRECQFDLSVERVAVVGVGNVAVDVARILCRTPEELATTDIADHALDALRKSRVREVHMLGRRGLAQAAFTTPEVRELGELEGADVAARPEEVVIDDVSRAALEREAEKAVHRKIEAVQEFSRRERTGKSRLLTLRFLVSPVEIVDDGKGGVGAVRLMRNRLVAGTSGDPRAEATGEVETLPADMVFRSVGYQGVALPGLPFDEKRCIVPNEAGRVREGTNAGFVQGLYVAGWIKRGPSGVIGTNKPDAAETVEAMLADRESGALPHPAQPAPEAIDALVRTRVRGVVSFEDWKKLNELEVSAGKPQGRPRVKFTTVQEMLDALRRARNNLEQRQMRNNE